jgi:xylulokinase
MGRDDTALAPALIWMDRRAIAETADVDPDLVLERAGVVLDATHMAAKIRWLQRHGPRDVARYHQPVSYLVARLTGEHRMDHGIASTTMLYHLAGRAYDETLLARFEISEGQLPKIGEASEVAGHLSQAGATMAGLPAGLPVAVGTGDDFSNPLGAGLA